MKNKKVELLAPAGTYESLIGAFNAGADAVYVGGNKFGARANAVNFHDTQLLDAIDYAHIHDKNLYLTVNTLLKNHELEEELYDYLRPLYEHGLDAAIVQDAGVLRFIRRQFPGLPIHASTQMTITGTEGAKFMEELGLSRVVTARELSLQEISNISKNTNLEIESFVHGALCYCYSGQCLYSSLIGGRSGNRGRCAQPCRLPYKVNWNQKQNAKGNSSEGRFVLSPKDMCTVDIIPELIGAGIYSFKIEGRMKSSEYTSGVVSIYRKYIDAYLNYGEKEYQVSEDDRKNLMDLYNRGGFSQGYYKQHNGREMISLVKPNHFGVAVGKVLEIHKSKIKILCIEDVNTGDVVEFRNGNAKIEEFELKNNFKKETVFSVSLKSFKGLRTGQFLYRTRNNYLLKELGNKFLSHEIKENIKGNLILSKGLPAKLKVGFSDFQIEITSDIVEKAINQPMTKEKIKKQIEKTGNTPFEFEELNIQMDDDIFIPLQKLNELRREALEKLKVSILRKFRRKVDFLPTAMESESLDKNEISDIDETEIEKTDIKTTDIWKPIINAHIEKAEYFDKLVTINGLSRIYIDFSIITNREPSDITLDYNKLSYYAKTCKKEGKECYLVLPHIFREDISAVFEKQIEELLECEIDGILIKNFEEYGFLTKYGYQKSIVTDHNLYTFNKESKEFWRDFHVTFDTAPLELNYQELKTRGCHDSELIIYGYLPMMVTAGCIKKTLKGCDKQEELLFLKDRYQKEFCVRNNCTLCINTIYNTSPLILLDNWEEIKTLSPHSLRLHFTIETPEKAEEITKAYIDCFFNNKTPSIPQEDFTRGHFKRGIE